MSPIPPSENTANKTAIWNVTATIHESLPPYTLMFMGYVDPDGREHIETIAVSGRQEGQIQQQIQQLLVDIDAWSYDFLEGGYVIEDLNFDGYADLRLQEFLPASPNIPYLYWLYNPERQQFEANAALREITSPEVLPEQQTIRGFARLSAASYIWSDYQWRAGELMLVREEQATYDTEGNRRVVVSERQGDEMVVVSDRFEAVE